MELRLYRNRYGIEECTCGTENSMIKMVGIFMFSSLEDK